MRKRSFDLTDDEQTAFRVAERQTRDAYEFQRLQAVRLYGSGESIVRIQQVVDAAERTIREWVARYQETGLSGLANHWQGSNAKKLTDQQRSELLEKLKQYRPAQVLGAEARTERGVFWTVSDLQMAITQWYGVSYSSVNSYYTVLRAAGLSVQKVERIYRSQPSAAVVDEFEAELEKK